MSNAADAAGNPIPQPPEATQLPADPGNDSRIDQIRAEVQNKIAEVQELVRQAVNDLSARIDDLQEKWDQHQGGQSQGQ